MKKADMTEEVTDDSHLHLARDNNSKENDGLFEGYSERQDKGFNIEVIIQRWWRRCMMAKHIDRYLLVHFLHAVRMQAAISIQKAWKGKVLRDALDDELTGIVFKWPSTDDKQKVELVGNFTKPSWSLRVPMTYKRSRSGFYYKLPWPLTNFDGSSADVPEFMKTVYGGGTRSNDCFHKLYYKFVINGKYRCRRDLAIDGRKNDNNEASIPVNKSISELLGAPRYPWASGKMRCRLDSRAMPSRATLLYSRDACSHSEKCGDVQNGMHTNLMNRCFEITDTSSSSDSPCAFSGNGKAPVTSPNDVEISSYSSSEDANLISDHSFVEVSHYAGSNSGVSGKLELAAEDITFSGTYYVTECANPKISRQMGQQ